MPSNCVIRIIDNLFFKNCFDKLFPLKQSANYIGIGDCIRTPTPTFFLVRKNLVCDQIKTDNLFTLKLFENKKPNKLHIF